MCWRRWSINHFLRMMMSSMMGWVLMMSRRIELGWRLGMRMTVRMWLLHLMHGLVAVHLMRMMRVMMMTHVDITSGRHVTSCAISPTLIWMSSSTTATVVTGLLTTESLLPWMRAIRVVVFFSRWLAYLYQWGRRRLTTISSIVVIFFLIQLFVITPCPSLVDVITRVSSL